MERRERFYDVPPARADHPFAREEDVVVERMDEGIVADRAGDRTMAPRDRVRWGPIWAGLLTAFSVFLLLELLAYALGWLSLGIGATDFPGAAGRRDAWVTAILGLISFFLGGLVTGATALVRGASAGLLNGFSLWALATVLTLVLSALGLGVFFGAAGNAFNQLLVLGRGLDLGAAGLDLNRVSATVRNGALWAFIAMALSAAAAMLGGWVGSQGGPIGRIRRTDRIER